MNKQRKVLITTTYNEIGIIIDTKAEEVARPTCNQLATDCISRQMAIEAFEPTHYKDWYTPTIIETLETLPSVRPEVLACGNGELVKESDGLVNDLVKDCISRKMAIDVLSELREKTVASDSFRLGIYYAIEEIKNVPSAQPQRKKGKWKRNITAERDAQLIFTKVYNCSECGYESVGNNLKNFCPNCGCDMRGDEE